MRLGLGEGGSKLEMVVRMLRIPRDGVLDSTRNNMRGEHSCVI